MYNIVESTEVKKLDALAYGNTFGLIVLILHPIFHIWTYLSPESYGLIVRMFFPGFRVIIDSFDYSVSITILSTLLKSVVFWLFGFIGATLYNKLVK